MASKVFIITRFDETDKKSMNQLNFKLKSKTGFGKPIEKERIFNFGSELNGNAYINKLQECLNAV